MDRLAAEKKAQAAAGNGSMGPPSKRPRLAGDEDENGASSSGGVFKGKSDSGWLDILKLTDSPCLTCTTR